MTRDTNSLLSTTDPMVWSQEFCRIFDGWSVWAGGPDDRPQIVNEAMMVAWFANAFETGRREAAQAVCPHTDRFRLSEYLMACRNCGKLFDDE